MKLIGDLTPELKAEIDGMSYMAMLRLWRFAPSGTFQNGSASDYYSERMGRLKDEDPGGAVAASKEIGW